MAQWFGFQPPWKGSPVQIPTSTRVLITIFYLSYHSNIFKIQIYRFKLDQTWTEIFYLLYNHVQMNESGIKLLHIFKTLKKILIKNFKFIETLKLQIHTWTIPEIFYLFYNYVWITNLVINCTTFIEKLDKNASRMEIWTRGLWRVRPLLNHFS